MAALNPEYMIEFAEYFLGAGDARLGEAKSQLDAGKYYSSLLTVRNALKESTNVNTEITQPIDFSIDQNYPNPFNQSTIISFTLPKPEHVKISIFSILGKEVTVLLDNPMPAGYHRIRFDAYNMASGVYYYKIESGQNKLAKSMLYLR